MDMDNEALNTEVYNGTKLDGNSDIYFYKDL